MRIELFRLMLHKIIEKLVKSEMTMEDLKEKMIKLAENYKKLRRL